MPPRRNLTHDERLQIVTLHRTSRFTDVELAARFGVHPRTIWKLTSKYRETGSVDNRRRSGRPRRSTAQDDQQLVQLSLDDPHAVSRTLRSRWQQTTGIVTSPRTVRRRLFHVGLRGRISARRPRLTDHHIQQRLLWAQERAAWTIRQWKNVFFSDETLINFTQATHNRYVRRRGGTRFNPENVREVTRAGRQHVMVWGMFSYAGLGPLVRVPGTMNGQAYRAILQEHLPHFFHPGNDAVFMQDNARPHTAAIVTNWLAEAQIPILPWPANSPDLNPLENLWAHLKRSMEEIILRNSDEAWQVAQQHWNGISMSVIRKLIRSMPARVAAVIAAEGQHTKY